jgi:hypothetical protein
MSRDKPALVVKLDTASPTVILSVKWGSERPAMVGRPRLVV